MPLFLVSRVAVTLSLQIHQAFADGGRLSKAIAGFRARDAQTQMAAAVGDAITTRQTLVVEAGTGTGKTYAYLVPALLSGKKVIVSTGTKTYKSSCTYVTCHGCYRRWRSRWRRRC